ncbi:MAG: lactate/malate family dehydrogenase [Campylobacter sp.]
MKISVIGAGNVGASVASALVLRNVADKIALVDIFGDVAKAKAMDLAQSAAVFGLDIYVSGSDKYDLIQDSDIVIITAGSPRKDGQSREELLQKNADVIKNAAKNIKIYAPNSVIINVTNPLDVLTYVAFFESGFHKNRVIGMAGELDSARLKYEISKILELKNSDFDAKVIGSHNDEMVILKENISVDLGQKFEEISNQTKIGGAKIVKLLGTSAYYAPAAAVVKMCEAIKNGSNEWLSCCVVIDENLSCGRLVRLDKNGVKEIRQLSQNEQNLVNDSENLIRKNIEFLLKSEQE